MDMQNEPTVYFIIESPYKEPKRVDAYLYRRGKAPGKDEHYKRAVIEEYSSVSLHFECEDDTATLTVDTYEQDEPVVVKANQSIRVAEWKNTEDKLVPGDYVFYANTKLGAFEGIYRIYPKNLSWDALLHLRSYIERKLNGLTTRLLHKGMVHAEQHEINKELQIYQYLMKEINNFTLNLELINRNPVTTVEKNYAQRVGIRKSDGKSQRWIATKGVAKNVSPATPTFNYEKHAVITVDTFENRWINHILRFNRLLYRSLGDTFKQQAGIIRQTYNEKTKELKELEEKYKTIQTVRYSQGLKRTLDDMGKQIGQLQHENQVNYQTLKGIEGTQRQLEQALYQFLRFEQAEWLRQVSETIPTKPTNNLFKDHRYASLYKHYMNLVKMQNSNPVEKKTVYPYKRTSLLFEYYAFLLLLDVLQNNGFELLSGSLADEKVGYLDSGTHMALVNNDYRVEIVYDQMIQAHEDTTKSHYIPNRSNRPDILLSIYEKGSDQLITTLIIEVKYRRHEYLWNDAGETDVMQQLNDYFTLRYFNAASGRMMYPVKEIIILYPKQMGAKPFLQDKYKIINFVQIEPSDPDTNEVPFGYDLFEQIVCKYINKAAV